MRSRSAFSGSSWRREPPRGEPEAALWRSGLAPDLVARIRAAVGVDDVVEMVLAATRAAKGLHLIPLGVNLQDVDSGDRILAAIVIQRHEVDRLGDPTGGGMRDACWAFNAF